MVQVFDEWHGGSWLCLRCLCLVKTMKGKDFRCRHIHLNQQKGEMSTKKIPKICYEIGERVAFLCS